MIVRIGVPLSLTECRILSCKVIWNTVKGKRVVLTMQALVTIVASQCLLHCGGQRMYPQPQMLCSFTSKVS